MHANDLLHRDPELTLARRARRNIHEALVAIDRAFPGDVQEGDARRSEGIQAALESLSAATWALRCADVVRRGRTRRSAGTVSG